MGREHTGLYDELKLPMMVLAGSILVSLIGNIYVASETVKILTAMFGELPGEAKVTFYASISLHIIFMSLTLYGLYKATSWARGVVALFFAMQLVMAGFGFYIVFVLKSKLTVLKISMLTNAVSSIFSGYALYLLLSPDVAYVLGKFKLENLLLGAIIGVGFATYSGKNMIQGQQNLANMKTIILDKMKEELGVRLCSDRVINYNLEIYPNYPNTRESCIAMYDDIVNTCQHKVMSGNSSSLGYRELRSFVEKMANCVKADLRERVE